MWHWMKQEKPEEKALMESGQVVRPVATLIEHVTGPGEGVDGVDGVRGKAHIIIDDHCYVLILETFAGIRRRGRFRMTPWIFKEAFEILRDLPPIEDPTTTFVTKP